MNDLIARLEAATEGSRELDREIAYLVGHAKSVEVDGMSDVLFEPSYPGGQLRCNPARYTTSLDAALTLVPEGHITELVQSRRGTWWNAYISRQEKSDRWQILGETLEGISTPALALCIAALKAIQAEKAKADA